MDKESVIKILKDLKKDSQKKFVQSVDLIVALKDLNLKKPEEQVEFFATIPFVTGKKKVCAFVGRELVDSAKTACDFMIEESEFAKYKDAKKDAKKLAREYDFFISQANIMPKVAGIFGRTLGTRGKMPNPKAGCVVPPNANLPQVVERLQSTIKVSAKKSPLIQIKAGTQDMPEDHVAENILSLAKQILAHLPKERHNLKVAYIKLTMSKPVKLKL